MARKGRKSQVSLAGESMRVAFAPAGQPRCRPSAVIYGDRYITERNPNANLLHVTPTRQAAIKHSTTSPSHVARLAYATSMLPGSQILSLSQLPALTSTMANPLATPLPPHPLQTRYHIQSGEHSIKRGNVLQVKPHTVLDAPEMRGDDEGCSQLLVWSTKGLFVGLDRRAYLWDPTASAVSIAATLSAANAYITTLEWSSRFSKLALLSSAGAVVLMDLGKSEPVWKPKPILHDLHGVAHSMCFADSLVAAGYDNGELLLFDPRTRDPARKTQAHSGGFSRICARADGRAIASAGDDGTLKVWDTRQISSSDANPLWAKRGLPDSAKALAWCPWHASVLAVDGGRDNTSLFCWNVDTDEIKSSKENFASTIKTIQFSPIANQILTTHGLPGNCLQAHRYPSMTTVATSAKVNAHYDPVAYAAISPRGDVVATGSADQAIRMWRFWQIKPKRTYHPSERNTIRGTEMLR